MDVLTLQSIRWWRSDYAWLAFQILAILTKSQEHFYRKNFEFSSLAADRTESDQSENEYFLVITNECSPSIPNHSTDAMNCLRVSRIVFMIICLALFVWTKFKSAMHFILRYIFFLLFIFVKQTLPLRKRIPNIVSILSQMDFCFIWKWCWPTVREATDGAGRNNVKLSLTAFFFCGRMHRAKWWE